MKTLIKIIYLVVFLVYPFRGLAQTNCHFSKAKKAMETNNYELAVKEYKLGAAEGNVDCIGYLAASYLTGLGTEMDLDKAMDWANKGYQKGGIVAALVLGVCTIAENETAENYIKARPYLKFGYDNLADEQTENETEEEKKFFGICGAYIALSYFYEGNMEYAKKWIERVSIDYPDIPIVNGFSAIIYFSVNDFKTAVKYASLADKEDDLNGTYILGCCLADGTGIKQDKEAAFKKVKKAAEAGLNLNGAPYCTLGNFYYDGIGTSVSKDSARRCWIKALYLGSSEAKENLHTFFNE